MFQNFFCIDKEKPKYLYCPGDQVNETNKDDFQVFWNEPTYTDNCQDNSSCQIKVTTNLASGSKFTVSSPYTVRYKAKDPSGNVNEECTFKVTIKKKKGIFQNFI